MESPGQRKSTEPDHQELAALATKRAMRADGASFRRFADAVTEQGMPITHTSVRRVLADVS